MKIPIKTKKEIKIMQAGGRVLAEILRELCKKAQPGVNLLGIEEKASQLIKKTGGQPSFKMVKNYHWATCLNINEGVVHGVPRDYRLKEGDLLTIDIGLFRKGFHTDTSCTLRVQAKSSKLKAQSSEEVDKFLKTGRRALAEAVKQAVAGNYVGHISAKIQKIVEAKGYSCVKTLTGHGVGRELHEPPAIPCFLKGEIEETAKLKRGMTLAIEVIYSAGSPGVVMDKNDGWTVKTADGKIAAVFEKTIAILDKPLVLTSS